MVYEESQENRHSAPSRSSRLPKVGQRRRSDNLQYSYTALGSRKGNQSSNNNPEPKTTIEREDAREKDTRSHRTSQDSIGTPSPRTSPSPNTLAYKSNISRKYTDSYRDLPVPDSQIHIPKPSVSAELTVYPRTGVPPVTLRGSVPNESLPYQVFERKVYMPTKMDDETATTYQNLKPKELTKDESYVHISEPPSQQHHEREDVKSPDDAIRENSLDASQQFADEVPSNRATLPNGTNHTQDDMSYADVVKSEPEPTHSDGASHNDATESESESNEKAGESYAEVTKSEPEPTQSDGASYADVVKSEPGLNEKDGVSYADVLRSSKSESESKDHDDDESYPDLDDMGLEDVHRPPVPKQSTGNIRWAPWNVPLKRRLQTGAVLTHSLAILMFVSIFFALCANPFAWPLLLIYLVYVLSSKAATDGSLKYRSEWFRKSYVWHLFGGYFPARLHKTHDLPPTRKYIFGYHPHGIISHGAWVAFGSDALGFSEKFPNITNSLLTLDSNFRIPLYREYILGMGIRSVSKESIVNILSKGGLNGEGMGRAVTIVVGGARESLEARPGTLRLVLNERKGFIKLAVRTGADLVPVLAFGENDLYDQLEPREHPLVHKMQMFVLRVWKFTLPFLHGRGIFNYDVGLMPYRRPLNVVVGAPIKVTQSATVVQDEINRLHGLYAQELEKLWERYRDEFAGERKEELIMH